MGPERSLGLPTVTNPELKTLNLETKTQLAHTPHVGGKWCTNAMEGEEVRGGDGSVSRWRRRQEMVVAAMVAHESCF